MIILKQKSCYNKADLENKFLFFIFIFFLCG